MSKKILVLGAGGLLGSALCPYLESRGHQVIKQGRRIQSQYNVDITEADEASKFFSSIQPEVIINLAALTNVDYCETHPQEAYRVNSHIVENISDWLKSAHSPCHLIQISTDQLYDGSGLHQESKIDPANYYSFSKYIGELAALKVDGTVLRVNFFGLSGSDNRISFTDWLFQALQKKDPISVFEDVFFSPLCIESLVEMIELVVILKPIGTYNVG